MQQLPMLYAVLFIQSGWKYSGVGVGNLFFFDGGKKRNGKSSFAAFGFAAGGADCKCAFSFAVDFFASLIFNYVRILFTIGRM
ncbi:hypothetical protein [Empedobacter stercoris]|uniref:hypothetical protein n=1 Tax=Empedobacter stercoris TaxID=1628248 RepID=UPI0039EC9DDF